MARLDVPDGPVGEAATIWTLTLCVAVFLGRSLAVLGVDQSRPIDA